MPSPDTFTRFARLRPANISFKFTTRISLSSIVFRYRNAPLEKHFVAAGSSVRELKPTGKNAPFDAAETLGLFMNNGQPEAFRLNALVGTLIKSTARKGNGGRDSLG